MKRLIAWVRLWFIHGGYEPHPPGCVCQPCDHASEANAKGAMGY